MARSEITVRKLTGPRSALEATPGTHYDAADATNDHTFTHPGGIVLLYIRNGSGSTMNVTVNAVATVSTKQMAQDITEAVDNGNEYWVRIGYDDGYINTSGQVDIDIDQSTSSYLAVFQIT